MPTHRRRDVLGRRRRVDEEGEDEGSITEPIDDSQSDASVPSDDDGDADDSDLSETDVPDSLGPEDPGPKANGSVKPQLIQQANVAAESAPTQPPQEKSFSVTQDTEAMMNGLRLSDHAVGSEALDFDAVGDGEPPQPSENREASQGESRRQETPGERKRREHEEYKKQRDENPAFVPTRGNFFMHDHRTAAPGPNGFRPFGRGRGRGRDPVGGPFSPANMRAQSSDATSAPWAHDLHDTLHEPDGRSGSQQPAPTSVPVGPAAIAPEATAGAARGSLPVRNFSTTRDVAYVQLRVLLPGMKEAVTYANTKIKQYTKLPDHRPPLRRDKPVRISLPDKAPRYIFPAVDRSFIFIPRALRPNQQGFGRGRSRLGSMGGFSSRRTSVFGGSVYSPSVPISRRSSFAREFNREGLSPAGSVRPVVRLPPGSQQHTAAGTPVHGGAMSGHGTPVMNAPPPQGFPVPQKPTFRENWPANMPMHQPRPQKAVSVAGIESPASMTFNGPPQQDQQPFQHQLPPHVNGGGAPPDASNFYPRGQPYPTQTTGTPLSNIPERAIHAPAFQPFQQPAFQPAAPAYYYTNAQPQYPSGAVIAPMFVQNGQQGTYILPTIAPAAPQPVQPANTSAQGQPAMVAHEQNGMVYYYDPSQLYAPPDGSQNFSNYTMPGMGGMMTPTPDGYYYPQVPTGPVYYPQQ